MQAPLFNLQLFLKMHHSVLEETAYASCHISYSVLCLGKCHGDLFLTSRICFREDDTFSLNSQAVETVLDHETFSLAYISTVGPADLFKVVGPPDSQRSWLHSLIASFCRSSCGRVEASWTWTQFTWI